MKYKSSFHAILVTVRPLMKGTRNLGQFTADLIDMGLVPFDGDNGEKTALDIRSRATWKGYTTEAYQLPESLASEQAGRWDQYRFATNASQVYEESAFNDLAYRLRDLGQTIQQMDLGQVPLLEQEQPLAAEAECIARHISGELETQLQALSSSLAGHNAIIAMQVEREQHLERKQTIEDELQERKNRTFPKDNFNPLDEYPKTFWPQIGANVLDVLGACAFPDSKTPGSRANYSMLSLTAKPKRKRDSATGRSSTPPSCSLYGNTSPPRTPHTTPACSSSTPRYWGPTICNSAPSCKKPAKPSRLLSMTTAPSQKTAGK
ncbi:hypothetical protein QP904_04590 [Corynebacterium kefirresidentii]|uniref:hypothetical protein n=1 Tax=Corynebacterium sp. MSK185 TaxID=3377092 RepID=UPI00254F9BAE|nr:hypothetical protein [Corynebacterium kefirresidentii]MDK8585749.1 hypothetical protein [Corynebacterium kefirresidentii]